MANTKQFCAPTRAEAVEAAQQFVDSCDITAQASIWNVYQKPADKFTYLDTVPVGHYIATVQYYGSD